MLFWMIPLYLLAMGIGYFVALKATEEVGFLKYLGNAIAGVLIAGSFLGIICSSYLSVTKGGKGLYLCPFQKSQSASTEK